MERTGLKTEPPNRRSTAPAAGTVLVVDDLEANLRLLEQLLLRERYRVIVARDGIEAIERVDREHPDVILMDVMMPALDGFETCRRLKNTPATCLIPVVLITAMPENGGRIKGLEVGADDFLRKPVDPAELSARVRSLVRIKRYTDELDTAESVVLSLGMTIEARDPMTDGHCQRLSRYKPAVSIDRAFEELGAEADRGWRDRDLILAFQRVTERISLAIHAPSVHAEGAGGL